MYFQIIFNIKVEKYWQRDEMQPSSIIQQVFFFFWILKGGYAHSNMHILHFWLIDLDLWNAFCEVSPWGSFLFTLQRQKKVCTPGDEAVMKIHKKLFSGIPINFMLFVISPKLQRIWSWNFGFAIRKIWAFIWYQKIYYFRLSPGGWEYDRHKGL